MSNGWRTIKSLPIKSLPGSTQNSTSRLTRERDGWILLARKIKARTAERRWMRNPVWPSSCVTPAGTSNELDVQNEWEENTHTHIGCSPNIDVLASYDTSTIFLNQSPLNSTALIHHFTRAHLDVVSRSTRDIGIALITIRPIAFFYTRERPRCDWTGTVPVLLNGTLYTIVYY